MTLLSRAIRFVVSLAGVALVTWAGSSLIPVNATTIGFAYLLLVLVIATIWGFLEALAASIVATLSFNFFFLPPVGKLTIADPQNWITSSGILTLPRAWRRLAGHLRRNPETTTLTANRALKNRTAMPPTLMPGISSRNAVRSPFGFPPWFR